MTDLGHYVRLHLTGSAGGIELFGRGSGLPDADDRAAILHIRDELVDERAQLLDIARSVGIRPAPLATVVAKVGERVARLKPNGNPLHRTPLTDLVDLEAMRVALAGKAAGWEAMLASPADLPREQLEGLLAQARRQHDEVSEIHARAAARALTT